MESSVTIDALIKAARKLNMKAVALTDKYMMGGAVEFYNAAVSAGIKPVIGCELCLSDSGKLFHIVLLAKEEFLSDEELSQSVEELIHLAREGYPTEIVKRLDRMIPGAKVRATPPPDLTSYI